MNQARYHRQWEEHLESPQTARRPTEKLYLVPARLEAGGELQHLLADTREIGGWQGVGDQKNSQRDTSGSPSSLARHPMREIRSTTSSSARP